MVRRRLFDTFRPVTAMLLFGVAVTIAARATPASAQTLPPSIRACIGESDAGQRLTCYDRAVARLIAPADTFAPAAAAPPAATAPTTATAPPAKAVAPAPASPRHLSAKVSAVRQSGDDLIVTLDNGAVWEQSEPATIQLNLHAGDVVQIDREVGGWFLSNRYGEALQVRPRTAAP